MPPELTPDEERQLDEMVNTNIQEKMHQEQEDDARDGMESL